MRNQQYLLAEKKFRLALRAGRWAALCPGVQAIFVCNSLALGNVTSGSDVDFFVVTKDKRMFLTRLWVTAMIQALGLRRHGRYVRNRICLSFYVTVQGQNVAALARGPEDIYLAFWLGSLVPIFSDTEAAKNFYTANAWVKNFLPNIEPELLVSRRRVRTWLSLRRFFLPLFESALGTRLEGWARALQLRKMSKRTRAVLAQSDTRVIISDTMLKFHEEDRRDYFYAQWREVMQKT